MCVCVCVCVSVCVCVCVCVCVRAHLSVCSVLLKETQISSDQPFLFRWPDVVSPWQQTVKGDGQDKTRS